MSDFEVVDPLRRDVLEKRAARKLRRRDRRIAGLTMRIAHLEAVVAAQASQAGQLPRDLERAVQRALCNVRMIPVLGLGGDLRITSVTTEQP